MGSRAERWSPLRAHAAPYDQPMSSKTHPASSWAPPPCPCVQVAPFWALGACPVPIADQSTMLRSQADGQGQWVTAAGRDWQGSRSRRARSWADGCSTLDVFRHRELACVSGGRAAPCPSLHGCPVVPATPRSRGPAAPQSPSCQLKPQQSYPGARLGGCSLLVHGAAMPLAGAASLVLPPARPFAWQPKAGMACTPIGPAAAGATTPPPPLPPGRAPPLAPAVRVAHAPALAAPLQALL